MQIFDGIEQNNIALLTNCLQAVKKTYFKDEIIIDTGDKITSVGYLLKGKVQLIKDDYDGNKIIIATMTQGDTFGEAFVCAGVETSKIQILAIEDSQILYLNLNRILSVCSNACEFHKKLIENIIKILATRNLALQDRIELLSKKTLRERILYLLHNEKPKDITKVFEIPYSREQMANYIGADRSALSRELSRMKQKNLIDYHKNSFKLT